MTAAPETLDPLLRLQQNGLKVYLTAPDRFRLIGLERLPGHEAAAIVNHCRAHKPEIIQRLSNLPAPCEVCPAASLWDYSLYASKGLICFYAAWFLGRSGSPAPCRSARISCPLLTQKEINK